MLRRTCFLLALVLTCAFVVESSTVSAQTVVVLSSNGSTLSGGTGAVVLAQPRPFLAWLRPRARRFGIFAVGALRFYAGIYNIPLPPPQQQPSPGGTPPKNPIPDATAAAAKQAETDQRLDKIERYLGLNQGAAAGAAGAAEPPAKGGAAAAPDSTARTLEADIAAALHAQMANALLTALEDPRVQTRIRDIAFGAPPAPKVAPFSSNNAADAGEKSLPPDAAPPLPAAPKPTAPKPDGRSPTGKPNTTTNIPNP